MENPATIRIEGLQASATIGTTPQEREVKQKIFIDIILEYDATNALNKDTLEDVVEPYLLTKGFIRRTPRGRIATKNACTHIGVAVSGEEQQRLL